MKFKTLTTLGDRSFTAAAPQLWNSLPYSIRSSPSVASFKKTLKTFLFQKAFLWFYVLFNLVFSRFYAVFYDLSSLGNFYSFSVDIIVLLFLVGSWLFACILYVVLVFFFKYFYFQALMKIAILISALYKPSHFPSHTMLKALNREIFRTRLARYPQPVQRDIPVEAEISPVNEASMEK